MRFARALTLAASVTFAATVPAQMFDAASAYIADHAPATDDPDQDFARLVKGAKSVRGSTFGNSLLQRLWSKLASMRDPAKGLALLDDYAATKPHGVCLETVRGLRYQLLRNLGRGADAKQVDWLLGCGTTFTVSGPFGDTGDHFFGVPFRPERGFPGQTEELRGRYGPIRNRKVVRGAMRRDVRLQAPGTRQSGCFYALHQLSSASPVKCFLEVGCTGSFELWLNGMPIGSVNRATSELPYSTYWRAGLRKGHNHVLIKTTDNRYGSFALRYLDAEGHPLAGITEFADAPKVQAVAATDNAKADNAATILHPVEALTLALEAEKDPARAAVLRLATALLCERHGLHRRVIELLNATPADSLSTPDLHLALAIALRGAVRMPAELRRGQARKLVKGAEKKLAEDHYALVMAVVRLMQEEDRHEDAIRRLRKLVDAGKAGPATFERLYRAESALGFTAEQVTLLEKWRKTLPHDARPVMSEVRWRDQRGDRAGARRLVAEGLQRHPANNQLLLAAVQHAAERGEASVVDELLNRIYSGTPGSLDHISQQARYSRYLDRRDHTIQLFRRVAGHPEANQSQINDAAEDLHELGDRESAMKAWRRSLAADPSQHSLRRRMNRMNGKVDFPAIARFRRDPEKILGEFRSDPKREQGASSTILLDQIIVRVYPDGSQVSETHVIRRINDLQGIQAHKDASAANAQEVVRVRTIAKDGKSYVPNRVARKFSMPRLQPGCFIEEVSRDTFRSPAPGPWRTTRFYLQSMDEPFLLSELVIILPKNHRGTFRTRNFQGKPVVEELEDGLVAYVYRMVDMPRLRTEALAPPLEELVPVVVFGEDNQSDGARRGQLVQIQRERQLPDLVHRQTEKIVMGLASDAKKAAAIHRFVHQTIEDGRNLDPAIILSLKKGSRFHLQRAMLHVAKVPVRHAMLEFAPRELRREPAPFFRGGERYPVSAMLLQPADGEQRWVFMDMPRHYPIGRIPAVRGGAGGKFVDDGTPLTLPTTDVRGRVGQRVRAKIELLPNERARLTADVELLGPTGFLAAAQMRDQRRNTQSMIARRVLGGVFQGWRVESSQLVGLDKKGEPLRVTGTLARGQILRSAGGDLLMALPLTPLQLLAGLGGRGERKLPMLLAGLTGSEWEIEIDPGKNYRVLDIPATTRAREDALEYDLICRTAGNKVRIRRSFLLLPATIPPARFDEWRGILQQVDRAERAQLRFRGK